MSYGQTLLKRYLTQFIAHTPLENYRPSWLQGLEIDFFYPGISFAVEFQGDQHYTPVFGQPALVNQKRNDGIKRRILKAEGIAFLKLDAVDLESGRLRSHIRRVLGCRCVAQSESLRALDHEAKEYRRTLKRNFSAITVHRKKSTVRTLVTNN